MAVHYSYYPRIGDLHYKITHYKESFMTIVLFSQLTLVELGHHCVYTCTYLLLSDIRPEHAKPLPNDIQINRETVCLITPRDEGL